MNKKHLTYDDRLAIQAGLQQGLKVAQIAKRIGKDRSTVGREIKAHRQLVVSLHTLFIYGKTGKVGNITPMRAIRNNAAGGNGRAFRRNTRLLIGKGFALRLAIRQLITGKRRYTGACLVAVLLVFFASLVGRMDSWLGSDGKGMMDAFNPAEHDIGVQVFGNLTSEGVEDLVRSYSGITDSYLLAMPQVSVNGTSYTANVITEPERFHMLQGKTCQRDDEIVLTEFVASDLNVDVGDVITVKGDAGSEDYTVSGIYQCANDMGSNVGMNREGYLKVGKDNPHLWCYHYFLQNTMKQRQKKENWKCVLVIRGNLLCYDVVSF